MAPQQDARVIRPIPGIHLPGCKETRLRFSQEAFDISYCDEAVRIKRDEENFVTIRQQSQQVAYKATILGGFVLHEETTGSLDYSPFFRVYWEDDLTLPRLVFLLPPSEISRTYEKEQHIELGLDEVTGYDVHYSDGATASFERWETGRFDFRFSTGFYGSFWQDDDGSYTLKFRGDRLGAADDPRVSQSKFVVTRSRYSDRLLLILQESAKVFLR